MITILLSSISFPRREILQPSAERLPPTAARRTANFADETGGPGCRLKSIAFDYGSFSLGGKEARE